MTVNDTDKFLVNRSGSSYHVEAQNLMATLQDTDLLLVNRSNKSYKVTWGELKDSLGPPETGPIIESVVVTEVDSTGNRFEGEDFVATVTMREQGNPVSEKTLTAYIEGQFAKKLITDEITDWNAGTKTLTFNTDKDISLFEENDIIRQNETTVIDGWDTFDANKSNTVVSTKFSAITQSETEIYIAVSNNTTTTTYLQKGPITQSGPWVEQTISNFLVLQAEIFDDVLYLIGNRNVGGVLVAAILSSDDGADTFTENILDVNEYFDWQGFAKWNGKYYAAAGPAGFWSSPNITGPYVQDLRFDPNSISGVAITPWGLAVSSSGAATTSNRALNQYILKEDNSIQEITATLSVTMQYVDYRDSQLIFTGTAYSGTDTKLCFIHSTDGVNFTTTEANWLPARAGGITARGTLAISSKAKSGNTTTRFLVEFDPTTGLVANTGIVTGQGFGNSTYSSGLLIITIGKFADIYVEGILAPLGVVGVAQANPNTITLLSTTGDWSANTGNWGVGPVKAGSNTKKYLQHDASGNVQALLNAPQDPAYTTSNTTPTITYKFPDQLDGLATDEKIKEGSKLVVEATATNSVGSDGPVSGEVTPQP